MIEYFQARGFVRLPGVNLEGFALSGWCYFGHSQAPPNLSDGVVVEQVSTGGKEGTVVVRMVGVGGLDYHVGAGVHRGHRPLQQASTAPKAGLLAEDPGVTGLLQSSLKIAERSFDINGDVQRVRVAEFVGVLLRKVPAGRERKEGKRGSSHASVRFLEMHTNTYRAESNGATGSRRRYGPHKDCETFAASIASLMASTSRSENPSESERKGLMSKDTGTETTSCTREGAAREEPYYTT